MNDLIITIGLVGSIASIISLFIAAPGLKSKITHIVYALTITTIATIAFEYKNEKKITKLELNRYKNVEQQAKLLLRTYSNTTTGSCQGFILASLTFLEKNKKIFPDTYKRAKNEYQIVKSMSSKSSSTFDEYDIMHKGSTAMYYLIKGIMPTEKY